METPSTVFLFDGMCNFCSGTVRWIIDHEKDDSLRFASLQSNYASQLIGPAHMKSDEDLKTVVVVDDGVAYERSDAILRVIHHLRWPWRLALAIRVVPRPIRDSIYHLIARNRYHLFGKRSQCMVPTAELRRRFLS